MLHASMCAPVVIRPFVLQSSCSAFYIWNMQRGGVSGEECLYFIFFRSILFSWMEQYREVFGWTDGFNIQEDAALS